jgi:hypothetical protein
MRGITPSNVPQNRLARFADFPQRAVSSRSSRGFDNQLTSALQQPGDTSAAARAAVAQRQTVAVSSAVRQNSGDPGRTSIAASPVPITPFNQGASSIVAQRQAVAVSSGAPSGRLAGGAARPSTAASPVPITPFNQGAFSTPARTAAAPVAQPAPAASETPENPAVTTAAAVVDVVRAALRKANIEPSGLNLYYEEIPVYYPGGSYVNRFVTLELAGGRKQSHDVGLMLKNPWLTAFEIGRFMSHVA